MPVPSDDSAGPSVSSVLADSTDSSVSSGRLPVGSLADASGCGALVVLVVLVVLAAEPSSFDMPLDSAAALGILSGSRLVAMFGFVVLLHVTVSSSSVYYTEAFYSGNLDVGTYGVLVRDAGFRWYGRFRDRWPRRCDADPNGPVRRNSRWPRTGRGAGGFRIGFRRQEPMTGVPARDVPDRHSRHRREVSDAPCAASAPRPRSVSRRRR